MNKLLVLAVDAKEHIRQLKAAGLQNLEIVTAREAGTVADMAAVCNIMLGDPPLIREVLDSAKCLQWVQSSWAGVDNLCRPELRKDYILTGLKDVFGPLISEYVMTYLFALERRVFDMRTNQSKRCWQPLSYRLSKDIGVGIIGLGSIGQELARTVGHFGIKVTGLNRSGQSCDGVEKVFTVDAMAEFLAEPDYVVITLPETPRTSDFINADVFRMMKPSAVLINVGRGGVINEKDLIEALQTGAIGGAVLDVFNTEPLTDDSPLWTMSNVHITPHNAAVSFPEDVVKIFAQNYRRFVRREPLLHVIDFDRGY